MKNQEKQHIMRPQDVVILLKKITPDGRDMNGKELSESLGISAAEISFAMERNRVAQLVSSDKKRVNVLALKEFLVYGVKYCFPAQLGRIVRGIPTASSASPVNQAIASNGNIVVWKDPLGSVRGQAVTPLFPAAVEASKKDPNLYALLAIVDALRIGNARERQVAIDCLDQYLQDYVRAEQ
ncbi:MAG: hypothetical protein IKH61_11870 [Bacteroidales bacterium]|jgi:hypothetical protein|nr:hypothetical protein [Bacteroidales bacterium]